ncbi:MAG: ATP-dependent DNA helicase RecG [Eubacteriales bacterium SKADARSKE-1]|nr:ATP-dependent DNA helicase RecG [Eubacteriales bacterium SKADARSKE-1]
MSLFHKEIKTLKGIGSNRQVLFQKLGVSTVGALLYLFPRNYEDCGNIFLINDAPTDKPCCIKATVVSPVSEIRTSKGLSLFKVRACDGVNLLNITFFNTGFISKKLTINNEFLFFGHIKNKEMISPSVHTTNMPLGLFPIYPQTKGLSSKQISSAVKQAFLLLPDTINDPIPVNVRKKYNLCDLKFAIENIHFPKNQDALEISKRRLVFEELLTLQLKLSKIKHKNKLESSHKLLNNYTDEFYKLLPFTLTVSQKKVVSECLSDIMGSRSMNRLIQGDVGCGKTVVAATLCYNIIKEHHQTAFMVPTEILAKQHYSSLKSLFSQLNINVELLIGATPKAQKEKIKSDLKSGKIDLIIGTHALISEDVSFSNLGLVITDEQHRFGVKQRATLCSKGKSPHTVVMSATPIPRSLALVIYGDLDISVIDEMPNGRQKVDTFLIDSQKKARAFNFIKKLIDSGQQAYIVCPLIDESELELISATKYAADLSNNHFKDYKVGLLHGKMKSAEKNEVMEKFISKDINILVCTTVIEVGIDVPNAAIIMIENAERLGLSQLHQLRGRVGRSQCKSYCILVSNSNSSESIKRLNVIANLNDGFKIADEDLRLRGPGDFFGVRQHGLPCLKTINFLKDIRILNEVKEAANEMLNETLN